MRKRLLSSDLRSIDYRTGRVCACEGHFGRVGTCRSKESVLWKPL